MPTHRSLALLAPAFGLLTCLQSATAVENLIRNGSFEGGLLYWHDQNDKRIVDGGKDGPFALQINKGWTLSAPIPMQRDAKYTISFWARSVEGDSRVSVGMPPMAREVANDAKRIWNKDATQGFAVTTEWQRFSATFAADVPRHGFWPLPQYGVYFNGSDKRPAIQIDGVTVVKGTQGTADYNARKPLEVVTVPTNLPGYAGAAGNMYTKGATATFDGFIYNPTDTAQTCTVRWQLIDYEGTDPLASPIDQPLTIQPHSTEKVPVSLPLTATGTVLARLAVLAADGTVIDSSDLPVCSLPYEKHATTPNYDERFGGSFAGGVECLDRMQRIGFGWTRWWANNKWQDFEPEEGKFDWSMEKQEAAWSRGISNHVVLYGWPKWIMDKDNPLPRDMRWKADDPQWQDLTVVTAWDRYITAAVNNFRGKPIIFQIQNEPIHDKWKDGWTDEYVQFTLRTAKLIKQLDPNAKVSVNNVYLNPSSVNAGLMRAKDFKNFDVWSWHDYHSGWIGDAGTMSRMTTMLKDANAEHLAVWLTEGWAFTNTLVDQPIACTGLTSVQSTHAIMNSVSEMTANGHDKFVMFHLQYGNHGMSFWDYSGPGNMIWDWYSYPTALVGGWNVMVHHIGLSDQVGFVRPKGANCAIFTDNRNYRGVMTMYADQNAKEDVTVELPIAGLTAEDLQGNPVVLKGKTITLRKSGRPVFLYTKDGNGKPLLDAMEPLDRKYLSFVEADATGRKIYALPEDWSGTERGTSDGNMVMNGDQPIWRLDRLYPNDAKMPANYSPMVWNNTNWIAPDHTQGGHPSASYKNGVIRLGTLGPWDGNDVNFKKQAALTFIVPESGLYRLQAVAASQPWGGTKADAFLYVMKKDEQRAGELGKFTLKANKEQVTIDLEIEAAAGHEIVLLTEMPNHNSSTNIQIENLTITKQ